MSTALPPAGPPAKPSIVTQRAATTAGSLLASPTIYTATQLETALQTQQRMPMMRIGETLVSMGCLTAEQLQAALANQQVGHRAMPLGQLLVKAGYITQEDLRSALIRKMGYPVVSIAHYPVDERAVKRVPAAVAQRLNVLPLQALPGRLAVVMDDPTRSDALSELEFLVQAKISPVLAAERDLSRWIMEIYRRQGQTDTTTFWAAKGQNTQNLLADLERAKVRVPVKNDEDLPPEQADTSLVRLVNSMIVEAHQRGVSDIHIETHPGHEKLRVRFRKDGVLQPYLELPHFWRQALIGRLKVMCGLDIAERRQPQDGKISFSQFVPGFPVELRVAIIPTHNGLEDAVLRLLDNGQLITLEELGLSDRNYQAMVAAITRPHGLVLCSGPTGSGKTTTLHSAMGYLNEPTRKIWTAEDPIEITQPGLRQVQINTKIGFTFAKALRAFLRADPDVIMVGEIRDAETALIAIESSLTGHLVLSTLHTNNATETVARLLDLGLDPFNFADALQAVVAQRLVRKLCPHCLVSEPANPADVDEWLEDYLHAWAHPIDRPDKEELRQQWITRFGVNGQLQRHYSVGCDACETHGSIGRMGIHEVLTITLQLRRMIQSGARQEELLRQAMHDGLRTMRQDGIEKVLAGLTSMEDVRAST